MASNPNVSVVEGMDINPEEAECAGWIEVASKKKKLAERADCNAGNAPTTATGSANGGSRTAASQNVLRRVVKASRIPNLPRDHFKTIIRPRGGMDVKKTDLLIFKRSLAKAASLTAEQVFDDTLCTNPFQNIFVVATPFEANARAYARVQEISMGKTVIGLAAYVAASDDTCKGVIRGINVDLSDAELTEMIVNRRNPDALGVRRIKKTPTVIVLFDGQKVPQHVLCDGVRYPCSLYRRQVDVCYACGDLGHRSDVCPKGDDQKKCRGCGVQSPSPDHQCDPTCAICGGAHPTADRKCKKRFQVPYIVRQRRRRRRRRARRGSDTAGGEEAMAEEEPFSSPHRGRSASRGRSRSRGRSGSKSRSRSRGRDKGSSRSRSRGRSGSKGRVQKQMSWADKARMNIPSGQEVTQGILPEQKREQSEILMLKKENAKLKEALRTLRSEFELFRNSREPRAVVTPIPVQAGGSNKRKAVSPPATVESEAMQSDESSAQVPEQNVLASLAAIEESLKQMREALAVNSSTIERMDGSVSHLARRVGFLESKMKIIDSSKLQTTNTGTIPKAKIVQQDSDATNSPQAMLLQ
ncbi:hypothetical protein HPB52_008055 [Rhipicephalus sanguineus]|uniref:CCHC-type domain-containing protein n=1 Tax=Rhipicephalus sanguineus TaxID=34632 RepID=A0A9D4SU43_RHISA|nr:hypothetical protein HPB52_008055 [Rhipicephalus sanguineus]